MLKCRDAAPIVGKTKSSTTIGRTLGLLLFKLMAIHDHTDLIGAIEKEVAQIAEYMDKLEVMEKYFKE